MLKTAFTFSSLCLVLTIIAAQKHVARSIIPKILWPFISFRSMDITSRKSFERLNPTTTGFKCAFMYHKQAEQLFSIECSNQKVHYHLYWLFN